MFRRVDSEVMSDHLTFSQPSEADLHAKVPSGKT